MRFLIIDDSPSRYDEFTRMLDREKIGWFISCDPEFIKMIHSDHYDAILLDHDMPYRDGRAWAQWIASDPFWTGRKTPVIITSTTGLEGVREEMLATLQSAGFPSVINPADHIGCETEWLSWMKGCLAGMGTE